MPQSRGAVVALCVALLFASLSLAPRLSRAVPDTPPVADTAKAHITESYGKLPLSFEENHGQTDPAVRFLAHGGGYALFLTPTEIVLSLASGTPHTDQHRPAALRDPLALQSAPASDAPPAPATTLRFSFPGANPAPIITAEDALPGTVNYFIGNDPAQWHTKIGTAAKVRYHDLYPGIDLLLYGTQGGQWEYDVVVAPDADPAQFALAVDGAESKEISAEGDLVLQTAGREVRQRTPALYQDVNGARQSIEGSYALRQDGSVGFQVGAYDRGMPLVIDPTTLTYSTYLDGAGYDYGIGIAVDGAGSAYITGRTSGSFPTTPGAFQTTFGGAEDAFVTKLNPAGTVLLYSTYLGGTGGDGGNGIAVDGTGNAYVTGDTNSTNFPTTLGAYQTTYGGGPPYGDAFVAKFGIGASPPPNPVPGNPVAPIPARPATVKTVGSVNVYASSFTTTANGWSASGTVWIGEYTIVENVTVTLNNGALSGSGLVSMMTTSNGSQRTTLFQDSFAVNTTNGTLTPQAASGYQLKLANLVGFLVNPNVYQLSLDTLHGKLSGNLNLQLVIPSYVVNGTVQFTLDHTNAVIGSLTAPVILPINPLSLYVTKATLGTNGLTITEANWHLPFELGGATAAFNVANARVTGDGQFILGSGNASVSLPNITIGGDNGFGLHGASATLTVASGVYTFHGQGAFLFPGLVAGAGSCAIGTTFTLSSAPPPIQQVSLSLSGGCLQVPIGTTGFFITGVHGGFNLTGGQVAVDLGVDLQGGPSIPGIGSAISGSPNVHWDTSWSLGLSGTLNVFKWPAANASLTLDGHQGLIGAVHLSGVGVFDADGRIHLWTDGNHFHFTGNATATVQFKKGILLNPCVGVICAPIPPVDITGPSASAQFGEFRTPDASSVYGLKGVADIHTVFGSWHPAFFIDDTDAVRADLNGLTQYNLVDQTNSLPRRTSGPTANYPVIVGSTPALIVALGYDSGAPTITLTDPNGRVITSSTVDPAITYTTTATEVVATVTTPQAGNWTVTVGNLTGSEHYLVDALGAQPVAAIPQAPTLAPTTNGYTINLQATGATSATYSLYYDTDNTGNDGKPIATHLPISQTQATWDTRTAPNGSYYIYAILDDLPNAPVVAYSASSVTISDTTPPAIPTNLHASATGSDLSVNWQPSPDVDVAGYHISYQQPGAGQTFVYDVANGQASSATIHGLNINGSWQISISAYDINANESAKSGIVAVPISAVKTFSLTATAGGAATANPPGTTYTPGTVVLLTATTSADYTFTGWTVDGSDAGRTNPLSLTITGNHTVVANFGPLPTITGLSPSSGSGSGGGNVTINGAGFIAPATVTFDGLAATTVSISPDGTQLTVTPPAHAAGTVAVGITTPLGVISLANVYTYGVVSALPSPRPSVQPAGQPVPLPPTRPAPISVPSTPPAPLPHPRP